MRISQLWHFLKWRRLWPFLFRSRCCQKPEKSELKIDHDKIIHRKKETSEETDVLFERERENTCEREREMAEDDDERKVSLRLLK